MENFLTVNDLSEILKVSEQWIYKLVRQKRVPFIRVAGKALRFRESDIENWLEDGNGKQYVRDRCTDKPGENGKRDEAPSCS